MRDATRLLHFDAAPADPWRPVATPIYQTATFEQESASDLGAYDYTRSGNPTRAVLETHLAALEGGCRAFAFASGMAALSAVTRLASAGDHVIAGDDIYGGTYRLLSRILPRHHIEVSHVDTTDPNAVAAAFRRNTRLLLIETPTNPFQRVSDVAALANLAHERGALLAVDSTLMPPSLQRPLELGADIVVHSATKYLCGHSDVMAGSVAVANESVAEQVYLVQNGEGTGLAPFDSWLLLRGLKTLGLRVERQQQNACRVADFLAAHPLVRRVHFPGLTDHPGHVLHRRQARGPGALVSFETGSVALSQRLVEATRLYTISVSFGSVCSLASLPCRMSHASIPAEVRARNAFPEDLVRLSIGIEDVDDLIEDLQQALTLAARAVPAATEPEKAEVTA